MSFNRGGKWGSCPSCGRLVVSWNPARAVWLVEALWKDSGWRYPEGQGAGECVPKLSGRAVVLEVSLASLRKVAMQSNLTGKKALKGNFLYKVCMTSFLQCFMPL